MNYRDLEAKLLAASGLTRRPVAVAFPEAPPPGVPKYQGAQPAGCSFWRLAAGSDVFYTLPGDHYNCPIGSYTHKLDAPQLNQTLSLMIGLGYVKMEDLPGIFRLPQPPRVIVYAALGDTPVDPDVVLFAGRPANLMLLMEAANRAGVASNLPLLGRPTCMAIPAALLNGAVVSSGCIGSRTYTQIGDDELYVAIPGKDLNRLAQEIQTIAAANTQLAQYHQTRRQALSGI